MSATERFDPERLRENLAAVAPWCRIAFAASCVEVLVPSYVKFSELAETGDPDLVRTTVNDIWSSLENPDRNVNSSELPSPDAVKELLPTEDDWNEWSPQAEDAIASLVYLLELVRNDDVNLAAYTAERAYAAVDEFEAREQELGVLDADDGELLLGSTSIQTELRRQVNALKIMREPTVDSSTIAEIRAFAAQAPIGG